MIVVAADRSAGMRQDDRLDAGLEQIDGAHQHAAVGADAAQMHTGDAVAAQAIDEGLVNAAVSGFVDDGLRPGRGTKASCVSTEPREKPVQPISLR